MTYLDTGCFVKLYYPEPDSAKVIALIQGQPVCHTPLHDLEFVNALQLKHLVTPAGMGESFHVLVASKGVFPDRVCQLTGMSFGKPSFAHN